MCLDTKWSDAQKEKWLKDRPSIITAYKVVRLRRNEEKNITELWPPIFESAYGEERAGHALYPYSLQNILRPTRKLKKIETTTFDAKEYIAYFHLFLWKVDAAEWERYAALITGSDPKLLKLVECFIPKKCITTIGHCADHLTLVTREFSFNKEEFNFLSNLQKIEIGKMSAEQWDGVQASSCLAKIEKIQKKTKKNE